MSKKPIPMLKWLEENPEQMDGYGAAIGCGCPQCEDHRARVRGLDREMECDLKSMAYYMSPEQAAAFKDAPQVTGAFSGLLNILTNAEPPLGPSPMFERIIEVVTTPEKCECGAEAIKAPRHSDWCPKYEEVA